MLQRNAPLGVVAAAAEGCRMPRSALDTAAAGLASVAVSGAETAAASSPAAVLVRLLSRFPSRDRPEPRESSCRRGRACRADEDAVRASRCPNR